MSDIYKQNIIDHYKNPRNFGELKEYDFVKSEVNTLCGDAVKFYIKLDSKKERIVDIKFNGEGCAISLASSSMITEELRGEKVFELNNYLNKEFIQDMLGVELNPSRLKCAMLCVECLRKINFTKK